MASPKELSGIVLSRVPAGDRFLRIHLFDKTYGLHAALFPVSGNKPKKISPPDLFDDIVCLLNPATSETSILFVTDFQRMQTYRELAVKPHSFIAASEIAKFYLNNGSHLLDPGPRLQLLRSSLKSFSRAIVPKVVLLKLYYCFARDEGLPVRESWLTGLTKSLYHFTLEVLRMPVDHQSPDINKINEILESLRIWLNTETELRVE